MELNPETDLSVDVSNLTSEFKTFSITLYRYCLHRADVETKLDIAKAFLKETRALAYKRIKSDISVKHTEKSMEAELDTDPAIMEATRKVIRAEHEAATWAGAVDSMKAKKDCLIQLGSDRRKEI